jgi:hypothetical protein
MTALTTTVALLQHAMQLPAVDRLLQRICTMGCVCACTSHAAHHHAGSMQMLCANSQLVATDEDCHPFLGCNCTTPGAKAMQQQHIAT